MALTKQDKTWIKDATIEGVVGGLNDVMIPAMENMEKRITEDLTDKINSLDKKLVKMLDHHSNKLDNHEERIEDLEAKRHAILN
jgi:hypothetical protein